MSDKQMSHFDDAVALTFHSLDQQKYEEELLRTAVVDKGEPTIKQTNPKDIVGTQKAPMSTVSAPVLAEIGVAMLEGACKYGRHNYRAVGVRASVYYDATMRHLMSWWEGEDIDPDSGLSHITKAIATLVVMRDSMMNGNLVDDRPPPAKAGWMNELNQKTKELFEKYGKRNSKIDTEC